MERAGGRAADGVGELLWCAAVVNDLAQDPGPQWQTVSRAVAQPRKPQAKEVRVDRGGGMDFIFDAPPTQ